MADRKEESGEIRVDVCLECGKEYMFENGEQPPENLKCGKCGNEVFRTFHADTREGEALQDFRDTTERDVGTTDSASEVTRGDLHDLGNL